MAMLASSVLKNLLIVLVLSYLCKSLYVLLVSLGVGVHHNKVHPGKCRVVPGISCGSEQISVTAGGLAFITSGYRDVTRCNLDYLKGHIYVFDFNRPDMNVTQLRIIGDNDFDVDSFAPHGMDIFEVPRGEIIRVFVVNHARNVESIEVFEYSHEEPTVIVHKRTIVDDKFICINSVAVVDGERFYVTNLHQYCQLAHIAMTVELLFSMKTASVVYYDRGHSEVVARGAGMNGLALSSDKQRLLVIHGDQDVHVYARNIVDGKLEYVGNVFVGFQSDNIFLDKQSGDFYFAYFKNMAQFVDVAQNKTEFCGSTGGRLTLGEGGGGEVTEVFHDNGKDFHVCGASSFVHFKGQYLIGTVFDRLGYCVSEWSG